MKNELELLPIARDGTVSGAPGVLPEIARDVIGATVSLYERVGFHEPWIGYLAVLNSTVAGTCGFKSKPSGQRVEIAYFTFPEFEGTGVATSMARLLVELALKRDESLVIAAQTLADRNASHRVLEKLGFAHADSILDPEDGAVWEWQLEAPT